MKSMKKVVPFPASQPDVSQITVNGKQESVLSARGLVLLCLAAWKVDGNEKAHNTVQRYCEYITMHGYQGGAGAALEELDGMDKGEAKAWVRDTFALYVKNQMDMIQYVLNGWEEIYHG